VLTIQGTKLSVYITMRPTFNLIGPSATLPLLKTILIHADLLIHRYSCNVGQITLAGEIMNSFRFCNKLISEERDTHLHIFCIAEHVVDMVDGRNKYTWWWDMLRCMQGDKMGVSSEHLIKCEVEVLSADLINSSA